MCCLGELFEDPEPGSSDERCCCDAADLRGRDDAEEDAKEGADFSIELSELLDEYVFRDRGVCSRDDTDAPEARVEEDEAMV